MSNNLWQHPFLPINALYCINRAIRVDRKEKMIEQFQKAFGADWEKGVIWKMARDYTIEPMPNEMKNFDGGIGGVGCFRSHEELLKFAYKCKYERVLILEDDIILADDFVNKFTVQLEYLEKNSVLWDCFYLHQIYTSLEKVQEVCKWVHYVQNAMSTCSILWNKSGIRQFVEVLNRDRLLGIQLHSIDKYVDDYRKDTGMFSAIVVEPQLVKHSDLGDSDTDWIETLPYFVQRGLKSRQYERTHNDNK